MADPSPIFALKELVARLNREQYKVQDLLSFLGFALRSFKNLTQFLELIPLIVSRVTDADGGALMLFDDAGRIRLEQLHCQDSSVTTGRMQELRRRLELAARQMELPADADSSDRPATAPSPDNTPRGDSPAPGSSTTDREVDRGADLDRAIAAVLGKQWRFFGAPIWVRERERGRLYVFSDGDEFSWDAKQQSLVRLVADQTAVAIENDALTVELRKKERLDRELEIGAEIQLRLLPRQSPCIEGVDVAARCKTASRVGGDYYDFIPTDRDRWESSPLATSPAPVGSATAPWSIAIGDVMGKGVPAGLIMTMTRGMLRAEVLNRHSPARILQHLNRVMYDDLENSHRFVTLFYSEYDPKTRTLAYSNAAHHPPLLWRRATGQIERLDTAGMLIGLEADSRYEDAQTRVESGDTVIYYTDGLTDAADHRGNRFDDDRLVDAVRWGCANYSSAQDILDRLFDTVEAFVGSNRANGDDMTAIVLRVT